MDYFKFFDEYKKRVPEATPEQINEAFKTSNEHPENTFCTAIKRMIEEEQCIKETWKRRCALDISTSVPFEDRKEIARFNYGVQTYEDVLQGNLFFIAHMNLFKEWPGKCLFLCRPKRHGKTLLCSLTRCFYDVMNQSNFGKMFPGIDSALFNPRPCSFMVLSLSFDGLQPHDVELSNCGSNFDEKFQTRLRNSLTDFCVKYGLEFSPSSSESAITLFDNVVTIVKYLKVPMMIIVDEYDSSVNTALLFPEAKQFRKYLQYRTSSYFSFFTSLKKALQITGNYALVVGVTPLAIADFTSGFNISYDMTWNSQYQNMCGISVEDIQPVLRSIGQKYGWDETKINEIYNLLLDSYDGYHFGSESRVFNGGQLVNCLQELYKRDALPIRMVDVNTNLSESVLQFLSGGQNDKFYLLLMKLIEGPVLFTLFTSFAIDEVRKDLDIGNSDILLSLMVYYGALTSVKIGEKFYAKIPNKVARIVFVERLLKKLQDRINSEQQMQLSTAAVSLLEEFDVAPFVKLLLNSSLLPQENHGDVVHSMESTFKTRFQVLVLAGLPTHERERLINECCFDNSNVFSGQADTVLIPNDGITLLIEFKNSRISDLKNMPSTWQDQVKKSKDFLNYNRNQLLDLPLKTNSYNKFDNIRKRFDDASSELKKNALKLKSNNHFMNTKIIGFVLYRIGLHRVIFKRFDNL